MDHRCILQLCDPDGLTTGEAIRLAREVSHVEPNLAPHLGAFVGHLSRCSELDPRALRRALELFYAISDARSFAKTCERMSGCENPVASALLRWLATATPRRLGKLPH